MAKERITIFDTTLRDGEQSPGCSMNLGEKLRMARQLAALNVDVIEAGFPIASEGDFEAVTAVASEVRGPRIAGLARATGADIDRAWLALRHAEKPRIHVFLATSDIHLRHKLRLTRAECLRNAVESVRYARTLCDDVEFSPEDATRTQLEFLLDVCEAVAAAGATTLNIPDTVGFTVPEEMARIIRAIHNRVAKRGVVISMHCHNDLGLAVANTLAGLAAGARQVECTINGIGERAGNASLEEVVMAMNVRADKLPYTTGINTEQLYPASRLLSEITGVTVQPNKAIVGRNAFAHEAGVHQDGVLKNPLTYEIMTPQSVGVPDSRLVLGKHSGRHALGRKCEELGYAFERRELDRVYKRFVALADRIKTVNDDDLLALLQQEAAHAPQKEAALSSRKPAPGVRIAAAGD